MAERYRIELQSNIDSDWSAWLGNFELTHTPAGHTILNGDVADQAALHGLLARIRDLGIPFDNWWVLFLLTPVIVLFYQVGRDYKRNGRLTSRSIGPLIGSLVLSSMIATFLFDVNWDQLWPVFFIIGGIATLLRKRSTE